MSDFMSDVAQELMEDAGFHDYEVEDSVITCPDGERLEWDGACQCHGDSPLKKLGWI